MRLENFMCQGIVCRELPLGQMLIRVFRTVATLPSPTWQFVSRPSTEEKWSKGLGCVSLDAWACMFGPVPVPVGCATAEKSLPLAQLNKTIVALALLGAVVLKGHRQSPLLSLGSVPLPRNVPDLLNISVHVRGGDSCDEVIMAPVSRGAFHIKRITNGSCNEFGRIGASGRIGGLCFVRTCVHPSVHRRLLREQMQRFEGKVDRVLLATDEASALALFSDVPGLLVRSMDRAQLSYGNGWVERRRTRGLNLTDLSVSTLEDIRHLSAGHVFIGSTCSFFSRLAWNLMVARHGRDIPYVSVEACSPHLFREDTSPEELERTKQSDLANPDQRWAASSVVGNHGGY